MPRQLVACATVFAVLICNALCACGEPSRRVGPPVAAMTAAAAAAAAAADTVARQAIPRCHGGQQRQTSADGSAPYAGRPRHPAPPCDHHKGDSPCQHCRPVSSIAKEGKIPLEVTRPGPAFAPVAAFPPARPLTSALLLRATSSNDPSPPIPSPTLLSLSCSLTT